VKNFPVNTMGFFLRSSWRGNNVEKFFTLQRENCSLTFKAGDLKLCKLSGDFLSTLKSINAIISRNFF